MIKVLIIEDNIEKLKRINSFLEQECSVNEKDIHYAENVSRGRELLIEGQYDLLLLDLVLPFNEGDDPSAESGAKFLDEIYYNPNINIPIHIIGLTEFDTVFRQYLQDFEDKLWGLINFKLQNNDWSDKLKSKVFYLQNFKKKYKDFIEQERKFDIAIITANNTEFEALKRVCNWDIHQIQDDCLMYYSCLLNTKNNNNIKIIACCINQMGMQSSAAVASKILSLFSPKQIYITGICAGIKSPDINLGDIIIANQVWDYESGKITEDQNGELIFKPDMNCLPTDQSILSKLTDFSNLKGNLSNIYNSFQGNKPKTQLNIKFGSVGSGPYVLSSKKYLSELILKDRKLVGIDMEGFGIYKAAQFYPGINAAYIKAISDFGDTDKNDQFHEFASYVSAKFLLDFIYNFY